MKNFKIASVRIVISVKVMTKLEKIVIDIQSFSSPVEAKDSVTGLGINPKRLALCSGCRLSECRHCLPPRDSIFFIENMVASKQTCGVPWHFIGENVASLHDLVDYTNEFGLPLHLHIEDQTNSVFRGTAGLEEQWVQRTRGPEDQRTRGTITIEDQRYTWKRGTVGLENQRYSRYRPGEE